MDREKIKQDTPFDAQEHVFSGEPENASGQESGGFVDPPPESAMKEVSDKKGGTARLLLFLVFVFGVAGAGFYLFGQVSVTPDPPVTLVTHPKPGKIKIPARSKPVEKFEGVKEEVVPADKVAAIVMKPGPVPAPTPAPKSVFALSAGGYLYSRELNQVIAQIEKIGYEVSSSQKLESHEMTRLLIGVYDKQLADKRLAEVKKISDGAFLVAEEGRYAVYVGSFLSLDKARRLADHLYESGVRVEERKVSVDLPHTTLRFGGFNTRTDAQKIVRKLEKQGIDKIQIVPFK